MSILAHVSVVWDVKTLIASVFGTIPRIDVIIWTCVTVLYLMQNMLACRLVGCQDLMEDVGSRVSKHDNLLTVVTYPPDYKSLPRRSRGTNRYRGSRDDHVASKYSDSLK